jgi:hypothetical protein
MLEYDILDVFSEQNRLSSYEEERMNDIRDQLNVLWQQKAWQRSRDRHILEGDRNTFYFHAVASQRRRKKKLVVLDGPNGPVHDTNSKLKIAADFYKTLFSHEDKPRISLGDDFWDESDMLT